MLMLFVACSGGSKSSDDGDAGTCPALVAPPTCVQGGLDAIYLAGAWTFTGTQSDDNCLASPPTETPVNSQFTFALDGCKWDQASAVMLTGSLDNTIARKSSMAVDSSSSMDICVEVGGALTLHTTSTTRCMPTNTTPRTLTLSGTLTR
jgi:hypothetical protein